MITDIQRDKLKQHLKGDYAEDVLNVLKKRAIVSRNNKPYSESMIYAVFSGRIQNKAIQDAIVTVFLNRKKEAQQLKVKIDKALAS